MKKRNNSIKANDKITKVLNYIKEQIGLDLTRDDYFTGIAKSNKEKYFNVILKESTSESRDYDKLKNFENQYKTIRVSPNGFSRVAIYTTMLD